MVAYFIGAYMRGWLALDGLNMRIPSMRLFVNRMFVNSFSTLTEVSYVLRFTDMAKNESRYQIQKKFIDVVEKQFGLGRFRQKAYL